MKYRIALTLFILVPEQVNRIFLSCSEVGQVRHGISRPLKVWICFLIGCASALRVVNIIKHVFVSVSLVNIPKIHFYHDL